MAGHGETLTKLASKAEEIAALANECCHRNDGYESEIFEKVFKTLVEAVEEECEACAKVCEDVIASIWEYSPEDVKNTGKNVCNNLAAAIRARNKK